MKTRLLIIVGIIMIVVGFIVTLSRSIYFLSPTEPPVMKPLEGIGYLVVVYSQAFLLIGIIGIFVTIVGIVLWRIRK